jgi:hypothetical protein
LVVLFRGGAWSGGNSIKQPGARRSNDQR